MTNIVIATIQLIMLLTIAVRPFVHATDIDLKQITLNVACERAGPDVMRDLALAYKLTNAALDFTVSSSTTPVTIAALTSSKLDFGTVIQGWNSNIAATAPNMQLKPLFLTGIVPVYRLDVLGPNAAPVVFTREIIVGMFTGNITKWNHPMFQEANSLQTMPDMNITMVFDVIRGARNWIVKNALYQFNSTAMNATTMRISNDIDYPFEKYANYLTVEDGGTALISQILVTEGSFTMAIVSTSTDMQVSIGHMRNKAGQIVKCTKDSLTFAALELGTTEPETITTAHVLTDASSANAWPFTYLSYVLVDTEFSGNSCRARQYLTEFLLWVYTSEVAAAVAANRMFSPVPSLILSQTGTIDLIKNQVKCRGSVALPPQTTQMRDISVSQPFHFIARLMTSIYRDSASTKFTATAVQEEVMVSQMVNSEIDIAIITQENVEKARWKAFRESDDFLFLPLYGRAITMFFNPELPSRTSIAGKPLLLDNALVSLLLSSCINNWNDTRLLALNPWLTGVVGNVSNPMMKFVGCGGTVTLAPLALAVSTFATSQMPFLSAADRACQPPNGIGAAFVACVSTPSLQIHFSRTETLAPSMAISVRGGMGYSYDTGDVSTLYPAYARTINGIKHQATSKPAGIRACASDTFDPINMSFNLAKSNNPECWPIMHQMVAVVRKKYYSSSKNTSSCVRGLDALKFLQFLITTESSDVVTRSVNVVELFNMPGMKDRYIDALNAVVCDDRTLLITLPIIWKLSEGLFATAIALSVIGLVVTNALGIYVIVQHRHPIMRSASPLFMLMSLFGVQMLFGSVIALVSDTSDMSCSALSWMVNVGLMVTFVPLFARVWRIYRIFSKRRLSVVKISNRKLMMLVSAFWLAELAFMAAWQGASQLQPVLSVNWEGTPSLEHHYTQCSSHGTIGQAFFGVAAAEKGALLLFGALMAFSTRKVQGKFNESASISLALYNIIFSIGIITPIIMVIGAAGDVLVALLMFMIIWIAFFTACVLVVPKAFHIQAQNQEAGDNQSIVGSSGNSSSGFSFLSLDMLSTLTMVGAYLASLRRHVEAVEQKQLTMKRQNGNAAPAHDSRVLRDSAAMRLSPSPVQKPSATSMDYRMTTQRKLSSQQLSTTSYPRPSLS